MTSLQLRWPSLEQEWGVALQQSFSVKRVERDWTSTSLPRRGVKLVAVQGCVIMMVTCTRVELSSFILRTNIWQMQPKSMVSEVMVKRLYEKRACNHPAKNLCSSKAYVQLMFLNCQQDGQQLKELVAV